ncbi:MAG: hypothetical protein R3349_08350 [Geminicoccaceae bacterium]|nr:hypothetical protein [Geminicoccaceae bacterium]
MTRCGLLGLALALIAATGVYLLKDRVQRSGGELRQLRATIQTELGRLDRLETEWAVSNQPPRLAALARGHLDLQPLEPGRLMTIDELPYRAELRLSGRAWTARLPSGADAALKLKPRHLAVGWSDSAGSARASQ